MSPSQLDTRNLSIFGNWRYAHIHEGGLRYLAKQKLITGLNIQTNGELGPSDGCALGKHHQSPFPKKAF